MQETKNKRQMTAKWFARFHHKEEKKAKEYIEKHIDWIKTHDFVEPILTAYNEQEIDSIACLFALQEATLSYFYDCELAKAEKNLEDSKNVVKSDFKSGAYTITIFCQTSNGIDVGKRIIKRKTQDDLTGKIIQWEEEEDMIYTRPLMQRAVDKAHRVLIENGDSLFAEIVNNYGPQIKTTVYRSEAFAAVYGKKHQVYMKNLSKKQSPLTSKMKSKNDHSFGPWNNKY